MDEDQKSKHNGKARRVPKQLPIITLAALLTVLLLIAGSGFWSYSTWVIDVEAEQLQRLSKLQAQKHAGQVELYIRNQQQQLNLFSARASMVTAAQSNSPKLLRTVIKSLKAAYPQALSLRLFSQDRVEHIGAENQPLSFTELDMINRAEQKKAVPPEAIRINKQWTLLFIASIAKTPTDDSAGTLLLALPAKDLFQTLSRTDPLLGQTRLLRHTRSKPALIYQTGEGTTQQQHSDINNSQWLIEFSPSTQLIDQASVSASLLIALHLVIGVGLLTLTYWLTGKLDPIRRANICTPDSIESATGTAVTSPGAAEMPSPMFQDQDILDIQVADEDADLLGLSETEDRQTAAVQSGSQIAELPDIIFRAYDIRGVVGSEITPKIARLVGQAVGSETLAAGDASIFVARDGRTHSPELCGELIAGILSSGCHVINLGPVPSPLLNFATCEFSDSNSGIVVTASHNPAEYNGFKMVINGKTLADDDILQIKSRMLRGDFFQGQGEEISQQVVPEYIDRIFSDVALAGDVKIVLDAANGITGQVGPLLFEELGCEVIPLFCDIDGNFPNHDPDPTIAVNLETLIHTVKETGADLGVAFDGDGDRLMLVTPRGQIIWPDRLLMLFAKDIVARNPGADVVFDVKCTRELNSLISSYGGRPIMWKSGHSHIKRKMQETGALLGGELSGHIFIKDRWYGFDDGMYAAARLLEIMTLRDQDIDSLFDSFPTLPSTPEIKITIEEKHKFTFVQQLIQSGEFKNGKPTTLDGLRVDFARGWGLVRASNTSAALTLRFEAETEDILSQIQALFKRELLKVDNSLELPF